MSAPAYGSCQEEVAAAFNRLATFDRPQRRETTMVISNWQTSRTVVDFVPPDRVREITYNGVPGYKPMQTLRVGLRAWSQDEGFGPWGWRGWSREVARQMAEGRTGFDAGPVGPFSGDTVFKCLGEVELEGGKYLGYQTRLNKSVAVFVSGAESEEEVKRRLRLQLEQTPQELQTVLVDPRSGLPAFVMVAAEGKLDTPRFKVRYTYPKHLRIARPFWCSIGLCFKKFPE
jgi:hypothetical protein